MSDPLVEGLTSAAGLNEEEAVLYLTLLREGSIPSEPRPKVAERLLARGMAIVSGDGGRLIPVHPTLGVANQYRTWREALVREINERRVAVDKVILQLIPIFEAAMEKRATDGGP
jgi:hypothetical protein